jgi:radical SAM superfamily enzyme YgiQ (UPF0313 family)
MIAAETKETQKVSNLKYETADVVLIYPKTGQDLGATIAVPHSLLTIAAPLFNKGYTVKIIDQRVEPRWQKELIHTLQSKPVCVGISCMTGTQIYFAHKAAQLVRRYTNGSIPIVWGGPHPSILPEQTLEDETVDIVCIGEGDITFLEIVEALGSKRPLTKVKGIGFKDGGRIIITEPRPLLDVERLLPVAWGLINVEKYIHPDFYMKKSSRSLDVGQTSRGCPFQCGFCCSATLRKRKWRAMSVEKSLQLILEPVRRFKLNGIWIRDDEFYISSKRTTAICEGFIRCGLKFNWYTSGTRVDTFNRFNDDEIGLIKKSGAHTLKYGAESGCNRILKLINKGITKEDTIKANLRAKKHGIRPVFAIMIGFPTETFDEINQTVDLMIRLKQDNTEAQFETIAPYTALPGTPMYPLSLQMGLRPPTNLMGWHTWVIDDYDIEGRKIPWFNLKGRKRIGNLCYISMLSYAVLNAIGGIKNIYLRYALKVIFLPLAFYYRFRLEKKRYRFSMDLRTIRFLRKLIFCSF